MPDFIAAYKWPVIAGLIVFLIGYVFILNQEVAYYKNKADALRIEVKQWQFTYKNLATAAEKQNKAVTEMAKIGEDMHRLGEKLLKDAQQANTIRQPKINAATARLNALIKTDCASAIADAKRELQ